MNRFFGSTKAKPAPSLTDAIASVDSRIDAVEVKIKKLDGELAIYSGQLKRLRDGPGKKAVQQKAMQVLKQKKVYEAQRETLQQQTFNMEQANMTTENLRNTMATMEAMKVAHRDMKKQYGKMDINKIESLHDEMEDLIESANEIQSSLGRSYGVPEDIDEEDLEAELDALGTELDMEDEAIPSYLQTSGPIPQFIDEPEKSSEPLSETVPLKAT